MGCPPREQSYLSYPLKNGCWEDERWWETPNFQLGGVPVQKPSKCSPQTDSFLVGNHRAPGGLRGWAKQRNKLHKLDTLDILHLLVSLCHVESGILATLRRQPQQQQQQHHHHHHHHQPQTSLNQQDLPPFLQHAEILWDTTNEIPGLHAFRHVRMALGNHRGNLSD